MCPVSHGTDEIRWSEIQPVLKWMFSNPNWAGHQTAIARVGVESNCVSLEKVLKLWMWFTAMQMGRVFKTPQQHTNWFCKWGNRREAAVLTVGHICMLSDRNKLLWFLLQLGMRGGSEFSFLCSFLLIEMHFEQQTAPVLGSLGGSGSCFQWYIEMQGKLTLDVTASLTP